MAHLAELFAKDLGVKIGAPILHPHFFPVPYEKYITIHTSDKVPAKNYSYWNTVVKILRKSLGDIKIVQVGTQADPPIEGIDNFYNHTTFNQSMFILKHALCHVGIDSVPTHLAAALETPTVTVYGHTYSSTCDTSWVNTKLRHIQLNPKRERGECPSFSLSEHPKTVDRILPEKIAEAVFKQLGMSKFKSEKTTHIGRKFLRKTIDIVPVKECVLPKVNDAVVRVRMDLCYDRHILFQILRDSQNKVEIVSDNALPQQICEQFKPKISKIVYTTEEFDERFLEYLRNSNIPFELNTTDEEKLAEQRNKFFHFDIVLEEGPEIPNKIKKEMKKRNNKVKFDTGKIYMVGDERMLTMSKNYDSDEFWLDAEYFRFYSDTC